LTAPVELPELVRSRVAYARRGLVSVRSLESLFVALALGATTLAAAVESGGALSSRGVWYVAAVNAALGGILWGREHWRSTREVARAIDGNLELHGELFTAWEVEGRERPTDIDRMLGRRVAGRLDARKMLRAALPSSAPLLALPFAAAALLFWSLESAREDRRAPDLESLVDSVERDLEALASAGFSTESGSEAPEGSQLTHEERRRLADLARAAGALGKRAADGEVTPAEVDQLRKDLADFGSKLPVGSASRRDFERAQETLESAALAHGDDGPGAAPGNSADAAGATGSAGTPGRGLAPGNEDGRMVGLESPPTQSEGPSELGVLGAQTWPEGYEGIVRSWVEATSEAREPR